MSGGALTTFLPGFDPDVFSPRTCRCMPTDGMDAETWKKLLFEYRPTILASCWGTPRIPGEFIDAPEFSLHYLCHLAGTVRYVAPRRLLERDVLISNWGNTISHTIAEHAVLLTLAALRCTPEWRKIFTLPEKEQNAAVRALPTRRLCGKRVGLHGFGAIARELVPLLKAFHAEVLTHSDGVPVEELRRCGVRPCATMEELFASSDVLIECKALTERTRNLVTGRVLSLLPRDAVFVNIGRGAVVDEDALARLAAEKRIRVALDVFAQEPLPVTSELLATEGIVLSPHIAGPTLDSLPDCGQLALQNIRRYLDGKEIEAAVTPAVYDRAT
ncbi:hypothetical protein AW736_04155 [Termitidicoccus mucosus]|uniref:D-isomer specific 2-hydroxyacid dehydrogenase NAD-binding domain-containing protein n=2 Tax=Termitidicoccus mucosus TaxID=1184151 RepID=A0A178INB8_9BACT|nr:hypothetical protein AW736_04155 [Opitutaceae bacterium TSB47]